MDSTGRIYTRFYFTNIVIRCTPDIMYRKRSPETKSFRGLGYGYFGCRSATDLMYIRSESDLKMMCVGRTAVYCDPVGKSKDVEGFLFLCLWQYSAVRL